MSQDYTTTALLASLQRRGMLPSNSSALSSTDFLAIATEEMQAYMVGLLVRAREEFLIESYDITATSNGVDIPARASGDKLRQVLYQAPNDTTQYIPLTRFAPETAYQQGNYGSLAGYYFQDGKLYLVPAPTTSTSTALRLKYYRRPGSLVATTSARQITAVGTYTITVAAVPADWTASVLYDVVNNEPSFETVAMDMDPTTVVTSGTTTLTFGTAISSNIEVGMWLCLAEQSPVPQIAPELHPLLIQRTKAAVLEALDDPGADRAFAKADKMEKEIWPFLQNRSEGNARPIVNRYGPGFYRLRGYRR